VGHVSQAGENQDASGQAGAGVNDAGDHGIPRKKLEKFEFRVL